MGEPHSGAASRESSTPDGRSLLGAICSLSIEWPASESPSSEYPCRMVVRGSGSYMKRELIRNFMTMKVTTQYVLHW